MNVLLAEHAGFCAGVARSVALAEAALREHGTVWCIGSLIHNRAETERLAALGLRIVQRADEVPQGAVVLLRAHGEPPETYAVLADRGAQVDRHDLSRVRRSTRIARETAEQGGTLLILGDPRHPEVRGIAAGAPRHCDQRGPGNAGDAAGGRGFSARGAE
jgi:4-hydroxy-3-methylbut-2-enyl diphosphate reductase